MSQLSMQGRNGGRAKKLETDQVLRRAGGQRTRGRGGLKLDYLSLDQSIAEKWPLQPEFSKVSEWSL